MSLGPTQPFYAVLDAGKMACPYCGTILIFGRGQGGAAQRNTKDWNPLASIMTCHNCRVSFQLGVIAWRLNIERIVNRKKAPLGQRPTLAQLAEIRKRTGGFLVHRARGLAESVNLHLDDECCCPPLPWRAECPTHGQHGVDQQGESESKPDPPTDE